MGTVDGKKTYMLAAAAILYALSGWYTGQMTMQEAIMWLFGSGFLGAFRHAIAKIGGGS